MSDGKNGGKRHQYLKGCQRQRKTKQRNKERRREREWMASRKRKTAGEGGDFAAEVAVAEAKKEGGNGRVTRSSTRRLETVPEPTTVKEKKRVKKAKAAEKEEVKAEVEKKDGDGEGKQTIVIEHCKQCNSFKTRAIQVKEGLESAIVGIQVLVNPEKPRRGCFEIREQGGETFISLLDMKRPFPPLKALDTEIVTADIVGKLISEKIK